VSRRNRYPQCRCQKLRLSKKTLRSTGSASLKDWSKWQAFRLRESQYQFHRCIGRRLVRRRRLAEERTAALRRCSASAQRRCLHASQYVHAFIGCEHRLQSLPGDRAERKARTVRCDGRTRSVAETGGATRGRTGGVIQSSPLSRKSNIASDLAARARASGGSLPRKSEYRLEAASRRRFGARNLRAFQRALEKSRSCNRSGDERRRRHAPPFLVSDKGDRGCSFSCAGS